MKPPKACRNSGEDVFRNFNEWVDYVNARGMSQHTEAWLSMLDFQGRAEDYHRAFTALTPQQRRFKQAWWSTSFFDSNDYFRSDWAVRHREWFKLCMAVALPKPRIKGEAS